MSRSLLSLAAGLLATTGVSATELPPDRGASIALGDVSGVAYYTAEPSGYRVVATLAAGETATPIRFVAVLQPGQKVVVSVPGKPGGRDAEVEIARVSDRVHIAQGRTDGQRVVKAH